MVHFNHIKEKVIYDYVRHDICSANFITLCSHAVPICTLLQQYWIFSFPYDRRQLNVQIINPEIGIT
jgi:hypothetical protein